MLSGQIGESVLPMNRKCFETVRAESLSAPMRDDVANVQRTNLIAQFELESTRSRHCNKTFTFSIILDIEMLEMPITFGM